MTPRSIRRAAERKAAKLARKQENVATNIPEPQPKVGPAPNRSTGPRTPEGKAVSCLNNTKHGLTGLFRLIADESTELFAELRDALREEHQPSTATEFLLVDRLAEHVWLTQRAQRFQNQAAANDDQSWFALMLRYETTHDRAFHKCLAELRTIRRERRHHAQRDVEQFESQNAKPIVVEPPAQSKTKSPAFEGVADAATVASQREHAARRASSNGSDGSDGSASSNRKTAPNPQETPELLYTQHNTANSEGR